MASDAFRFRLPRRWRWKRLEPGFGIGGVVEILDDRGRSTGLRCRIQLTGTDEAQPSKALSFSLPKPRFDDFGALDPPLLMVRYRAAAKRFYARWALCHEPFDARSAARGGEERLVRFIWTDSDRWDEGSPDRIERDLRLMRQLSGPGFAWPMRVFVEVEADALSGRAKKGLASAIRNRLVGISGYLAVVEEAAEAQASITFSPTSVRAAIGGIHAVTLHPRESYLSAGERSAMLAHVPLLIALLLTRAGQVETAARLCRLCSRGLGLSTPSL